MQSSRVSASFTRKGQIQPCFPASSTALPVKAPGELQVAGAGERKGEGCSSHPKLRHPSPQGINLFWELMSGCAPSAWVHAAVPTSVNTGDNDGNRGYVETKGSCNGGWVDGWSQGSGLQGNGQHCRSGELHGSRFFSPLERN